MSKSFVKLITLLFITIFTGLSCIQQEKQQLREEEYAESSRIHFYKASNALKHLAQDSSKYLFYFFYLEERGLEDFEEYLLNKDDNVLAYLNQYFIIVPIDFNQDTALANQYKIDTARRFADTKPYIDKPFVWAAPHKTKTYYSGRFTSSRNGIEFIQDCEDVMMGFAKEFDNVYGPLFECLWYEELDSCPQLSTFYASSDWNNPLGISFLKDFAMAGNIQAVEHYNKHKTIYQTALFHQPKELLDWELAASVADVELWKSSLKKLEAPNWGKIWESVGLEEKYDAVIYKERLQAIFYAHVGTWDKYFYHQGRFMDNFVATQKWDDGEKYLDLVASMEGDFLLVNESYMEEEDDYFYPEPDNIDLLQLLDTFLLKHFTTISQKRCHFIAALEHIHGQLDKIAESCTSSDIFDVLEEEHKCYSTVELNSFIKELEIWTEEETYTWEEEQNKKEQAAMKLKEQYPEYFDLPDFSIEEYDDECYLDYLHRELLTSYCGKYHEFIHPMLDNGGEKALELHKEWKEHPGLRVWNSPAVIDSFEKAYQKGLYISTFNENIRQEDWVPDWDGIAMELKHKISSDTDVFLLKLKGIYAVEKGKWSDYLQYETDYIEKLKPALGALDYLHFLWGEVQDISRVTSRARGAIKLELLNLEFRLTKELYLSYQGSSAIYDRLMILCFLLDKPCEANAIYLTQY